MVDNVEHPAVTKIKSIFDQILIKYNNLLGYDEIEAAYKKVSKIQEELQTIQSQRIDVQLKITQSQENLNNLNVELQEYRRGDPRYVEILKKEFEVNQSKKNLENKFNVLDRNEREVFGLLQSRINVLHDKSRIQFRQLGIVTTLLGAALGIVATSISAHYRNKDIKNITTTIQTEFNNSIDKLGGEISTLHNSNDLILSKLHHLSKSISSLSNQQVKDTQITKQNQSSWIGAFKSKTMSLLRWLTFQKQSSS